MSDEPNYDLDQYDVVHTHDAGDGFNRSELRMLIDEYVNLTIEGDGFYRGVDVSQMLAPVECKWCGRVHDSGPVEIVARYADCSVWRCPGCNVLVDDRHPSWGGGVYQLDRSGRRKN